MLKTLCAKFILIKHSNFSLSCNLDVIRLVLNNGLLLFIFIICSFIISIIIAKDPLLKKAAKFTMTTYVSSLSILKDSDDHSFNILSFTCDFYFTTPIK